MSYLLLQMNATESKASPTSDDRASEGERQVSESETVTQASDQRTRQVNYTLSGNSSLPGVGETTGFVITRVGCHGALTFLLDCESTNRDRFDFTRLESS